MFRRTLRLGADEIPVDLGHGGDPAELRRPPVRVWSVMASLTRCRGPVPRDDPSRAQRTAPKGPSPDFGGSTNRAASKYRDGPGVKLGKRGWLRMTATVVALAKPYLQLAAYRKGRTDATPQAEGLDPLPLIRT